MNFGQALEALKDNKLVKREGWNGANMFVFRRPMDLIPADMVVNVVKSLPSSVKSYYDKKYNGDYISASGERFNILFTDYLCLKDANDVIVNGWVASQTDMLANDWIIIDEDEKK